MSGRSPEFFFASAARQKITKYVDVAALALLVVEYLATLEMEIATMWPAERSTAKTLFFLSRYLALFDVPLAIYYHTSLGLPVRTCRILFATETTSLLIGVALAEAILFLRVYALSGRNKKFLWYLVFQFCAVHISEAVIFAHFLRALEFGPSPLPTVIGCSPLPPRSPSLNVQLSALFGLILANELSILLMTFIIGLMKYRNLRSPLIRIFYRDGFFYFLILSAISAGNITADLVGPPEYRFLIVILQRVMHSVLASRMILHMRDFATSSNPVTGLSLGGGGPLGNLSTGVTSEPQFRRGPFGQPSTTTHVEQDTIELSTWTPSRALSPSLTLKAGDESYFPGAYSENLEHDSDHGLEGRLSRKGSSKKRNPDGLL